MRKLRTNYEQNRQSENKMVEFPKIQRVGYLGLYSSYQVFLILSGETFEKLVSCDHGGCRHRHGSPAWT